MSFADHLLELKRRLKIKFLESIGIKATQFD